MNATPTEKKRQTYLNLFKDGVADGLLHGNRDQAKLFSHYYKQGYDFGLTMWNEITITNELQGEEN
jgi:hypothetical protein|tara:strand:- start:69 stop:266 length:198 start_codon:yes stop_codon:yes gene_type:complete